MKIFEAASFSSVKNLISKCRFNERKLLSLSAGKWSKPLPLLLLPDFPFNFSPSCCSCRFSTAEKQSKCKARNKVVRKHRVPAKSVSHLCFRLQFVWLTFWLSSWLIAAHNRQRMELFNALHLAQTAAPPASTSWPHFPDGRLPGNCNWFVEHFARQFVSGHGQFGLEMWSRLWGACKSRLL